ncbi:hypothetical protein [Neptunomonas japonica]|uniref:hypothetical protein n=1 Tax=Neptunomonas japonica TaxID=417574 RepID=UPI000406751D|nr:hypothetical protein [Neptunomonas japonica]
MSEQSNKNNGFVRTLIVLFCLMLVAMVFYNYFCVAPKGEINTGIISLISILLVLVLSESFDNFSIGKLISVTREVKKKEGAVKELEQKNTALLNQLITISNSQKQEQNHTNVYGDYHETPQQQKANNQKTELRENEDEVKKLLDRIGDSIVINEYEDHIKRDLEARDLDCDSDTAKILIKHLAGTQISLNFEALNQDIFTSQIELLRILNDAIPDGKPPAFVDEFAQNIIIKNSDVLKEWTPESYLEYLYAKQLIVNEENNIRITNIGVEYLSWLVKSGRSRSNSL